MRHKVAISLLLCVSVCQTNSSVQVNAHAEETTPAIDVTQIVNGKDYGAVADDGKDDTAAIQKTIDEATARGGIAYLPAGEYNLSGHLWLADNSVLRGAGDATVLRFTKGQIRSLKNKSKEFHFTDNYINEVVPNAVKTTLTQPAAKDATTFTVADAAKFKAGDWIYSDDNTKDTWVILEDQKRSMEWNDENRPMTRQQIFQIVSVQGNVLTVDRPLHFALDKGATIHMHVGARNFEISSLKIINPDELRLLMFEQPMNARFTNLTVEAKGGITLTHKPYNNLISHCRFITNKWRGVTVEYFASKNRIEHNEVEYRGGGDCAILVMVSSTDNTVAYNRISFVGSHTRTRDDGGIYIHATSYNNTVHHNAIDGTFEALGNFYGAFNNIFFDNIGTNVRMGIVSYYARSNYYIDNELTIVTKPPVDTEGALIFGSHNSLFKGNRISGEFVNGFRVQGSYGIDLLENTLAGAGDKTSLYGIRFYATDKNTGNDFGGVDPQSGLRRGNTIRGVKTVEGF